MKKRISRNLGVIFRRAPRNFASEVDDIMHELICANCKTVFPEYLARCPECGSVEWTGLVEVNPYSRVPMENFLRACGHWLWIIGTLGFLAMLWQTDNADTELDQLYIFGGIVLLVSGVLFSAAYFGLSEMMRRILRIQRRLRAFHDTYRARHGCGPKSRRTNPRLFKQQ